MIKKFNKKFREVKLQKDLYEGSQKKMGELTLSPIVKKSIIKLITNK